MYVNLWVIRLRRSKIDFSSIIPAGCGPFAFLPVRVTEPEVIDKGDAQIVEITDNFIIVKFAGKIAAGTEKQVTFKAKVLQP